MLLSVIAGSKQKAIEIVVTAPSQHNDSPYVLEISRKRNWNLYAGSP